ncbi:MAG: tRNA 2-thiouridine(34) synthase MnmA [Chloroherpetonaceae bacterium]|nr:tRNA 2-thiouridine(34) synthase MnmA [Chloroherpetonaceae bacterium]
MKKKVVVGMSGGVDSSVAACLLKEQGFDVIGITMKTWDYDMAGLGKSNKKETGCCSLESINDARSVAVANGFLHYTIDFREDFGGAVIDYFKEEYLHGRTPNPCVMCNTKVKWDSLLERAKLLGADYIATGHYARVVFNNGRYQLLKGKDEKKDQSYVLWGISQEALAQTLFPLSELTKPEVRDLARRYGLKVADKGESYEICFIPDNDYERFLKETIPALEKDVSGGKIRDEAGEELGEHRGYPFYTIGQRKGLGISTPEPVYVTEIDYLSNTIKVGSEDKLMHRGLYANQLNWIGIEPFGGEKNEVRCFAKIRYKDVPEPCTIRRWSENPNLAEVLFDKPKRAITPGQAVVFYNNIEVLGGGFIHSVIKD